MKFKIILREQTPKLEPMTDYSFIKCNQDLLIKFMKFARNKSKLAAGLASNQVSVDGERIMHRFVAIKNKHQWTLAIDPKIISTQGKKIKCEEGCLTWPGQVFNPNRHYGVTVRYLDLDGCSVKTIALGFHAQIWQHEIDHLNGVEEKVYSKKK